MNRTGLLGWIEFILLYFSPSFYEPSLGRSAHPFRSLITALFRLYLRLPYIFLPLFYVIWAVSGFIEGELGVVPVLLTSLLAAVLTFLGVLLLFFLLMFVEAVAKVISSLVLYGELPRGAENPPDALVARLVRGRNG